MCSMLKINHRVKIPILIGSYFLLAATLLACWLWFALITEGWFVPWDTTSTRPAVGTWERMVNDFFEVSLGAYLPGALFLTTHVILFAIRFQRAPTKLQIPFLFAMTNIIFLAMATTLGIAALALPDLWLAQPRPPMDAGFHRTWFAILITVILVGVLFTVQAKMRVSSWAVNSRNR